MKRKGLQRVLAMALSAAMVLTGITFPAEAVKAETIGSVIWSDDMETVSAADAGWTAY